VLDMTITVPVAEFFQIRLERLAAFHITQYVELESILPSPLGL